MAEPPPREPARSWIRLAPAMIRSVWGAREHVAFLEGILERSAKYVFIHSAFLTGNRAGQMAESITRALQRGVDVLVARGGTDEASAADDDGVTVFKKIAYDSRGARGRFFFEPYFTTRSNPKRRTLFGRGKAQRVPLPSLLACNEGH